MAVPIKTSQHRKAPDAVDKHVAARLRLRRLELGLTREAVAKALRFSLARFDRLERGEARIAAGGIDRLCPLFGVTPSYFFAGLLPPADSPHLRFPEPATGNDTGDEMLGRSLMLAAAMVGVARTASAEVSGITITRLRGFSFLPLMVMEDQKLVERHAREAGLGEIKVSYVEVNAGIDSNNALIAKRAQFVGGGLAPFLTIWDRTRGNFNVRAVSALDTTPAYLVSRNPKVHSVADFGGDDRINVLARKSSLTAILLEMAAAKAFGIGQYARLDHLTVGIPPSDSTALMIAGAGGITADFLGPPFVYQELENPQIHLVLSSRDVLDEIATNCLLYTSEEFHDRNPRTVAAVVAALDEAMSIIRRHRDLAAATFLRIAGARYTPQFQKLVDDPTISFDRRPHAIMKYAEFMHTIGNLKNLPQSWRDLFFPTEAATLSGN